jgi:hypothetical protein
VAGGLGRKVDRACARYLMVLSDILVTGIDGLIGAPITDRAHKKMA